MQPDTLIPDSSNPQSWNRFSYVLNNPIRYNDPTGHAISCDAEVDCKEVRADDKLSLGEYIDKKLSKYKVNIGDGFSNTQSIAILSAVVKAGEKFSSERGLGESGSTAFRAVFGYINFKFEGSSGTCGDSKKVKSGGCTDSAHQIRFWSMSGQGNSDIERMTKNVVHELGHAFDNSLGYRDDNNKWVVPSASGAQWTRDEVLRPNMAKGELSPAHWDWRQSPNPAHNEVFADMFIAWTYDAWNTDLNKKNKVNDAQTWMNGLAHP